MVLDLSGRQVFLASPGGLESERAVVRDVVARFNQRAMVSLNVAFIVRGWEEVPGGLGRPQSKINEIVDQCDFMIVLLGDRWGSDPGDARYSSGTEEEFYRAIGLCGEEEALMRNVLVLFRSVPPPQLADPGENLRRVLAFKEKLEQSKEILYGTFDDDESLKERVEASLEEWARPLAPRTPKRVALGEVDVSDHVPDGTDYLHRALSLAGAGHNVQAEVMFAKASQDRDPRALTEYARFLRRQGRLTDSRRVNLEVIGDLAAAVTRSSDQTAYLCGSLANLGVIHRKRGELAESERVLRESVRVAREASVPLPDRLAYALDNLAHTLAQLGRMDDAREFLEEAERVRREVGDEHGVIASNLNRGWHAIRSREFREAETAFEAAVELARGAGSRVELATALAGLGSARLKRGEPEESIGPLRESLAINADLGLSDGIGVAAGLLAKACVATGDEQVARQAADQALRESQLSSNATGLVTAKWVQAQVAKLRGDQGRATGLYDEALDGARLLGNASLLRAIEKDYGSGAST